MEPAGWLWPLPVVAALDYTGVKIDWPGSGCGLQTGKESAFAFMGLSGSSSTAESRATGGTRPSPS